MTVSREGVARERRNAASRGMWFKRLTSCGVRRIPGTALRYAPGRSAGSFSDRSAVPGIPQRHHAHD
jgi:hypothetical protein